MKILKSINPLAEISAEPFENLSKISLIAYSSVESIATIDEDIIHEDISKKTTRNLESVSINDIEVESVNELPEFLVATLQGYFGNLYRAKGLCTNR